VHLLRAASSAAAPVLRAPPARAAPAVLGRALSAPRPAPRPDVTPQTIKANFVPLVARLVKSGALGNVDAGFLAHYLSRYYVTRTPADSSGSVWDIGANKGDTSQLLISALVPGFPCYRFYDLTKTRGAACKPWFFPFIGVEMNPATAAVLRKRAEFERWDFLSYEVVAAGFSDAPGVVKIAAAEEGDETATLAFGESSARTVEVPLHSVDSWRETRGEGGAPIFLLKVDTEGFDGKVIKGAERALAGKHVKFLIAEYNSMWQAVKGADGSPAWSLRSSVAFLWGLGYECHLLNDQHFVPLWEEWWDASYEFWGHSNIVCAAHCDADLLHLVATARNASLPLLERPDCPLAQAGDG
jgi:FkbM family methyltransferase